MSYFGLFLSLASHVCQKEEKKTKFPSSIKKKSLYIWWERKYCLCHLLTESLQQQQQHVKQHGSRHKSSKCVLGTYCLLHLWFIGLFEHAVTRRRQKKSFFTVAYCISISFLVPFPFLSVTDSQSFLFWAWALHLNLPSFVPCGHYISECKSIAVWVHFLSGMHTGGATAGCCCFFFGLIPSPYPAFLRHLKHCLTLHA